MPSAETACEWANASENDKLFEYLDNGGDPEAQGRRCQGSGLLHYAALRNNIGLARRLLEAGASPVRYDECGQNPMGVAVRQGHLGMARLLASFGADPEGDPARQSLPMLCEAAFYGHADMALWLVSAGARVNGADSGGRTALAYCADDLALCGALVELGADVRARDSDGRGVLHWATEMKFNSEQARSRQIALFIEKGADPLATDSSGRSALDAAREAGLPAAAVLEAAAEKAALQAQLGKARSGRKRWF